MDDRTVVMVLESIFSSEYCGGAETQVKTLGAYLKARGVNVIVVAPMVAYGPQVVHETSNGLEVVRIPYPKIRFGGTLIMLARLAMFLVRHRHRYVAIHAHIAHNMAAVACLVGRLLGRPVVVKLTGMHEMTSGILASRRAGLGALLLRAAMRHATFYQATSTTIRGLLIERGFRESKVRLIPNAVDVDRFRPTGRESALRREVCGQAALVGIFVGRLVPEKGLEFLLHGWSRVVAPHHAAKLLLVGDGPLHDSLQSLVERLGIAEQVLFLGQSSTVERYLGIADFGVLPSLAEGLSNTLLEYLAAGLPVLGSRVSGTEDLVVPGDNGWLFASQDAARFDACLADVLRAPRAVLDDMGRRARERVIEQASMPRVAERIARLYGLDLAATPHEVGKCAESWG
jgi:glycosyltransferase involved in cell wall biosynthesis